MSPNDSFSLDWAPDAILVTGRDGSVVRANVRAQDLFGYRRDELKDKPLDLLIPEGLEDAIAWKAPQQQSSRIVGCAHRDGSRFRAAARWRPAREGGNEYVVLSLRETEGDGWTAGEAG